MPKFSVIIPVYSELDPVQGGASEQRHFRGKTVQRAIKSIIAQQYPDWELILVDDGTCDFGRDENGNILEGVRSITRDVMEKFAALDNRIKIIEESNSNRAIALNNGMDVATGDWICWLDSDDEYSTNYLREMNQAIKDFPEYRVFNHGAIVHWPDHHTSLRSVFAPTVEGDGHEWFRSGHIGTGSFVFRRDLWADNQAKYRIPDEVNAYQFAAASGFDLRLDPVADEFQYQNTENPDGAFTDHVYRHGLSLGNPWGQDMLQFYLLTRDNHSKPLDVLIYVQYPRAHEDVYEHFGEIYETI